MREEEDAEIEWGRGEEEGAIRGFRLISELVVAVAAPAVSSLSSSSWKRRFYKVDAFTNASHGAFVNASIEKFSNYAFPHQKLMHSQVHKLLHLPMHRLYRRASVVVTPK